jgi:hypothetical protein
MTTQKELKAEVTADTEGHKQAVKASKQKREKRP